MGKTGWSVVLSVGLVLASQMVRAECGVDQSIHGQLLSPDPGKALVLAQTNQSAVDPTAPPADSKPAQQPVAPSLPDAPSEKKVVRAPPSTPGCAVKFMAAELAGKLKGRKWKEFRQEECGPTTTHAVFPSTIAPKYSGEPPDKARTLTCADQFSANKAMDANGGLKWIERGGGYYSECVNRLKG